MRPPAFRESVSLAIKLVKLYVVLSGAAKHEPLTFCSASRHRMARELPRSAGHFLLVQATWPTMRLRFSVLLDDPVETFELIL